ncbi:hypothetical protein MalM25_35990 [Planctomycetes bacterium MalM25]|nr:hypothetical protein MalM25_35990 [Planctomycetes bacterium MalM25]
MRARTGSMAVAWLLALAGVSQGAGAIDLTPDSEAWRSPARVEADLRLAGEATPEPTDPKLPAEAPRPIELRFGLAYTQEKLNPAGDGAARVARLVDGATGPNRLLVAHEDAAGACVVSADGVLTRNQLDRVQLPADPLDIDTLLPAGELLPTDSWQADPAAVQRVLRVDSTTLCEVTGVIETSTARHAKLRFAGPVHGLADGARVEIDLRGVALFDRQTRRITRLNLAWREERAVGPATPALTATAKLNLKIQPPEEGHTLDAVDRLIAETTRLDRRLAITTGGAGWRLLADRDWFVVAGDRHATTLRRVTGDGVSMLTTLAPSASTRMTLATLEQEIRYTLGSDLATVLSTEQTPRADGETIAIASAGKLDGRPVEWRHHHVSTDGVAIAATTTLPTLTGPADDAPLRRLLESLEPTGAAESAASRASAFRR